MDTVLSPVVPVVQELPLSPSPVATSPVSPAEAVLRLQPKFRRAARSLARWDEHLREDLVQEMALVVLKCKHEHKLAWFRQLALWRALDYMRRVADLPKELLEEAARLKRKLVRHNDFKRVHYTTQAEG